MCLIERFLSKTVKVGDCLVWTAGVSSSGYGVFWYEGKHDGAHRVSHILFKGEIPESEIVMHECDTPLCVNPNHLSVGTYSDNSTDRDRKGRGWTVKLSLEDVEEIRERYQAGGVKMVQLGEEYGVHHSTISRCVNKKYWK